MHLVHTLKWPGLLRELGCWPPTQKFDLYVHVGDPHVLGSKVLVRGMIIQPLIIGILITVYNLCGYDYPLPYGNSGSVDPVAYNLHSNDCVELMFGMVDQLQNRVQLDRLTGSPTACWSDFVFVVLGCLDMGTPDNEHHQEIEVRTLFGNFCNFTHHTICSTWNQNCLNMSSCVRIIIISIRVGCCEMKISLKHLFSSVYILEILSGFKHFLFSPLLG